MAKITFVDHSGESRTVDVENGATVMEAAIRNAIPGIEAECGGACACATCHVYVDEAWREKVGPPSPTMAHTSHSGRASFAPTAAGSANPIVPRPPDVIQVCGSETR